MEYFQSQWPVNGNYQLSSNSREQKEKRKFHFKVMYITTTATTTTTPEKIDWKSFALNCMWMFASHVFSISFSFSSNIYNNKKSMSLRIECFNSLYVFLHNFWIHVNLLCSIYSFFFFHYSAIHFHISLFHCSKIEKKNEKITIWNEFVCSAFEFIEFVTFG